MQGVLALTCVMLIAIYLLLHVSKSGVYSDPSSIASIASLIHHPGTVEDLYNIDQTASKKEILNTLSNRRYTLDTYTAADGTSRYGIISYATTTDSSTHLTLIENLGGYHTPPHTLRNSTFSPLAVTPPPRARPTKHARDILQKLLLTLLTLGLLALIVYYYKNSSANGFEAFMNSQSFGPRFLLTSVALIIKSQWQRLERQACIRAPYAALRNHHRRRRDAPLPPGILARPVPLMPVSALPMALRRREADVALLAATALLAEALIILVPAVPFGAGQLWHAALASWYGCMALLGFMALVLVRVWLVGGGTEEAREKNSVGAVAVLVAESRWAEDVGRGGCVGMGMGMGDDGVGERGVELRWTKGVGQRGRWVIDYAVGGEMEASGLMDRA